MQPLDLNLASNPFRNNTMLWLGYGSAALLLLLFSLWNVQAYREHRGLLQELRSEVGTFDSQKRDLETRATRAQNAIEKYDLDSLRIQSEKANEVINWKAFSWTRLFNSMENVQPEQVRMNAIRPLFRSRQRGAAANDGAELGEMPVAIEGTARSFADFAKMEHALQDSAEFRRVWPERANRIDNGEILFQLSFLYDGARAAVDEGEAGGAGEAPTAVAAAAAAADGDAEPDSVPDGSAPAPREPTEVRDPWPATEPPPAERRRAAP